MRRRLSTIAGPLATATLALGTAAWAATGDVPLPEGDRVRSLAVGAQATGPLVSNDRDGSAILSAGALVPGQIETGEVTIGNAGDVAGAFTLSASGASGPLADVLDLTVVDATASQTVFAGKLATFARASLGTFAPGASRRYRFQLAYRAAPAIADNALQGATTSVRFDWDATASGGAAGPNPTQAPATPTPVVAAPAAPAAPAATATAKAPTTAAPATTAPLPSVAALTVSLGTAPTPVVAAPAAPAAPAATATAKAPTTAAPATTAPLPSVAALTVSLGTAPTPVAKGRLITWMSSSTTATARVTGTVSFSGKSAKLPAATVKLTAKRRTVRLKLPAAAAKAAAKRALTVRLTIAATAGGRKTTVKRTLRVAP